MIFKNKDFGRLRSFVTSDEIWFIVKELCEVLGYSN